MSRFRSLVAAVAVATYLQYQYAMEPGAGEDWLIDPPSLMIILSGKLDQSIFATDPASGVYIMWAGTPYEHLMVPVADLTPPRPD